MAANKRPNGDGTIRKKTITRNGKEYTYWEGRISAGTDPKTGKAIRKTYTGKTQAEVKEKMNIARIEMQEEGEIFEPTKCTVAQWCTEWLEILNGKTSYNTITSYTSKVENHIIPKLGGIKLAKLSKLQVQKFIDDLSKQKSPNTVITIHAVLSKCLSDATEYGYIKRNVASRVKLPKIIKGENTKAVKPLTEEQIKEFLRIADTRKFKSIIRVILFTGLRESEILGLTWDCIDFKNNTITVKQQLQYHAGKYELVHDTKSHKQRTIKVAPSVIAILREVKTEQLKNRLRAGELWQGWKDNKDREKSFVFTNELGRYIPHQNVIECVKRIFKEIGLPEHSVHDLRHEYAVLSLQNGDDVKTVQENLGHATASFTLDVYGHVSEKMKNDSADRMEQYIKTAVS